VRAILPGFAYQLGNLAMAYMGPFQAGMAKVHGDNYASVMSWTIAVVAAALILVTALGPEARSAELKVT
jgi:SHS family lactate transporter-like MFS transporter